MSKVYLKKNEENRILSGHLWVFSNEITDIDGDPANGDLVEVYSFKHKLLGSGFYNRNSLIAVRIINQEIPQDLQKLFRQKITAAYQLRKQFYPERESFRMVYGESDFLPGLIIDKYNSTYVLQVNSYGMEKNIELITGILKEFGAENIFTKNDFYFRTLEGLTSDDKIYLGEPKDEIISDGRITYLVNFSKGQKTGFFFDQADNRAFTEKISEGKKVLDAFCNSGGFGLHAASAGAASVHFVDSSSSEINAVKENYSLNNFTVPVEFTESDVFDFLHKKSEEKEMYDLVIIDPPAFTKGRKNLPQAKKGYEKLNRLALEVVKEDGFLVTSSCSFHLNEDSFFEVITTAASKAGKKLQLIHFNNASFDHPELPGMPETSYLKFGVFKVNII